MTGTGAGRTLSNAIDDARLTPRYFAVFTVVSLVILVEFFDFFLIGYVMSMVAGPWQLTFGQNASVLMAAGVGAVLGSVPFGRLGDRVGRKPVLVASMLLFSAGTGAMALVPDGAWPLLAVFRFVVGAGVGGALSVAIPLLVEVTPTAHRTRMGSLSQAGPPVGILLASALAAWWSQALGWRGMVAIGIAPVLLVVWVVLVVPESPRWLLANGREDRARREISRLTGVPPARLPAAIGPPPTERGTLRELFGHRAALWLVVLGWLGATTAEYGMVLWTPTILTFTLHTTPAHAAYLTIFISLGGLAGRVLISLLAQRIGRRATQVIASGLGALLLLTAGLAHSVVIGAVSVFWLVSIVANVFVDGNFANLGPFTAEVFPTRLRALGTGVAESVNGIGKIVGPMILGLVAGAGNLISPTATQASVLPGYTLFAVASVIPFVAFALIRLDPHGRDLDVATAEPHERSTDVTATTPVGGR